MWPFRRKHRPTLYEISQMIPTQDLRLTTEYGHWRNWKPAPQLVPMTQQEIRKRQLEKVREEMLYRVETVANPPALMSPDEMSDLCDRQMGIGKYAKPSDEEARRIMQMRALGASVDEIRRLYQIPPNYFGEKA